MRLKTEAKAKAKGSTKDLKVFNDFKVLSGRLRRRPNCRMNAFELIKYIIK